jgi:hypothetical protein
MSKLLNPSVKVTLDRDRHLLYGAAAFIEFRELRGEDLMRFMQRLAGQFQASTVETADGSTVPNPEFEIPVKDLRDLLWAGLIHEDEDLTPKQTGNLFTLRDIPTLIPLIAEAFALAMPVTPGRPQKAPVKIRQNNQARSTGAA